MYCPSCGTAITQGLNYCNRCGANLVPVTNAPVSRLVGLVWSIPLAMALITLGGLGMLFFICYELVKKGADISPMSALMLLVDVLVIVAIDWMLLRQLSRVIDIYRPPDKVTDRKQPELGGKQLAQIGAPRELASFATEHTTRVFEPPVKKLNT